MSTICSTAFFSIHIRSRATSKLKTISDGGSETRKRCGGALNVWQVSHALVIFSNSCCVASSTWFGRACFKTVYNFPDVRCLKWRCSLIISDLVNMIYFEFHEVEVSLLTSEGQWLTMMCCLQLVLNVVRHEFLIVQEVETEYQRNVCGYYIHFDLQ